MTWLGLVIAGGAVLTYLVMLQMHRFTYRSWLFNIPVAVGTIVSVFGWIQGDAAGPAIATISIAALWTYLMTWEIGVRGSDRLRIDVGDELPRFTVATTDGEPFTNHDLIANAPALLQLYRGWWCPSSDLQLEEMLEIHDRLRELGVTTYAASVDSPDEAAPLQEKLGSAVTILCNVENTVLDALGVEDRRGAAWYSRLMTPGEVQKRSIAMPSAIAIDRMGRVVYAFRTDRVDQRADPNDILNAFSGSQTPKAS
jgi:peroxiredoxin